MRTTIIAAWLVCSASTLFAQSIGFNVVSNSVGGIDDTEGDALLATDLAGVPSVTPSISGAQTNWNNISRYGSGTFILTNSLGGTNVFDMQWDSGYSDATGTQLSLGTPDGTLMNSFMTSWGPGAASPLGTSCYNSPINDKPLVYISGLNAWYTNIANAEGYGVVLYTTGYSYWEQAEGYVESVTGSPLTSTMAEGSDLAPHLWEGDNAIFAGTYTPTTGTDSGSATYGANYMFFTGLTNDAILIRLQSHGYGAGMNGFQFVPIFPTPPTATDPTFSPSSTVYAQVPVTITEAPLGDPFHPTFWYQWQSDTAQSGTPDHNILNATNATLNVVPTNAAAPYTISYACIVSNIFGVTTSSVQTLTVNPAVAPFVTQDTTPGPGSTPALTEVYAYAGGSISFTAAFGGTPPTYLWQSNSSSIPGATSTTLTLNNLPLSATASYDLTATNSVGGTSSTPTPLVVLADPPAPDASVPYPYDVFTNGPIAYWRLSETLDNTANYVPAYDYSGNRHHAIYGAGAVLNQPGPQSPAYVGFESTNAGVTLANGTPNSSLLAPDLNLNTNAVTITAWINPSSPQTTYSGLFTWSKGGDKAGFGFGGNVDPGTSMAELGYAWNSNSATTYNFHSALYPPVGQWSFVALTISPTNTTIYLYYIDSVTGVTNLLKASQLIANQKEAFNGGTTWIGSDTSVSRNFNGTLDEMAVFGKTLSEAQIQDLFLKAIGSTCVAATLGNTTIYPTNSVYSGQNVELTAPVSGTLVSLQWQSSPDGSTWTDIPGATSPSVLVNPTTVGTVYYHLTAANCSSATNAAVPIAFTALPPTPPGLWTVNYQVTNNIISYNPGGGVGYYSGRGILGTGGYWNVLPDTNGPFGGVSSIISASNLRDDGATHSSISCSVGSCAGFASATVVQPDSSDIGNLLYQWVTSYYPSNWLQFHGVPDGTYNVCFYGCDGSFNDRGTTFTVHGVNGDQTAGTTNAAPIIPLQQSVNFVVFTNVHSVGGTLNVDVLPTSPVPTHDPNGEADFNGAQLQLVSYDPPVAGFSGSPTNIFVTQSVTFANTSTGASNWVWNFGDGNTLNTNSNTSVSHAYATAGTYTVSQTATGPLGTASVTNVAYIVVLPKPVIGRANISGGSFVLSGANGVAGAQYRVLTSSNVALPLSNWTPAWTNVFAPDGSYGYTNSSITNNRSFFILVSP